MLEMQLSLILHSFWLPRLYLQLSPWLRNFEIGVMLLIEYPSLAGLQPDAPVKIHFLGADKWLVVITMHIRKEIALRGRTRSLHGTTVHRPESSRHHRTIGPSMVRSELASYRCR